MKQGTIHTVRISLYICLFICHPCFSQSLTQRLDEVNQELEQKDEDFKALQQKCSDLEKQLADTIKEREHIKEVHFHTEF